MRRAALIVALLGAVSAAAAGSAFGARSAGPVPVHNTRKDPAHLLVYAQEWSLWPSRSSLPAGSVSVELWNRGQDAHDLRLRRLHAGHMVGGIDAAVHVTQSGDISQASWKLKPGRYMLYCSMPGHYMRGMHTVITVR